MKIVVVCTFLLLVLLSFSLTVGAQLKISPTPTVFNFSIYSSLSSGTIVDVGSVGLTLKVGVVSGAAQTVSFSCSGLPAGTTCYFSPISCTPSCSTTIKISTTALTPAGNYRILLVATDGKIKNYVTFLLTVKKSSLATPISSPITYTPKLTSTPLLSPTYTPLIKTPSPSPIYSPVLTRVSPSPTYTSTPSPQQTIISKSPTPTEKPKANDTKGYLLTVMRESLRDMDEDLRYWLQRIKNYNEVGKKLADRMKELRGALKEMGADAGVDRYIEFIYKNGAILIVDRNKKIYNLNILFEEALNKVIDSETKSVSKIKLKVENSEPVYVVDLIKTDENSTQTKVSGITGKITTANIIGPHMLQSNQCQEGVVEPDYDYSSTDPTTSGTPYFLDYNNPDKLKSDCDVLTKEEEIAAELNNALGKLNKLEKEMEFFKKQADSIVEGAQDSLDCIKEVDFESLYQDDLEDLLDGGLGLEIPTTPAPPAYTTTGSPHIPLGGPYPVAGFNSVLLTDLQNFYYAYNDAKKGKNYVKADLETLKSLAEGLEAYCKNKNCMFDNQKDYYQDLLYSIYDTLEYYFEEIQELIDDARGFADDFKNYDRDLVGKDIFGNVCGEDESSILEKMLDVKDLSLGKPVNISDNIVKAVNSGKKLGIKIGNTFGVIEKGPKDKIHLRFNNSISILDAKGKVKAYTTLKINQLASVDTSELSENTGQLNKKIEEMEEKLNTMGEDQQLAQIDLQNKLQQSQQLIQTMSNVSKMMYDTVMSIVRKIGG